MAEFVSNREASAPGALSCLAGVYPDLALGRQEEARDLEVLALVHAEAEQVLGDVLHGHRYLLAPEASEVSVSECPRARVGDWTRHDPYCHELAPPEKQVVDFVVAL